MFLFNLFKTNNKIIEYLKIENIIIYLFPIALITGPALTDILAVLLCIYFLGIIIFNKKIFFFKEYWIYFFILLWAWFLFISFFAYNNKLSFINSIIFIRFIIFTIGIYYFFSFANKGRIYVLLLIILLSSIFVILDSFFQFYNYDNSVGFREDIFGIKPEGLYGRLSGPFRDLVPGAYLARFYFLIVLLIFFLRKEFSANKYFSFFVSIILSFNLSIIYFSGERMALATTLMGITIVLIFLKSIRKIQIFSLIFAIILIVVNHLYHPHYQNIEIISSSASHEGLLIEKKYTCYSNELKICSKRFNLQPKFFEILKNFSKSSYAEIYLTSFKIAENNLITGIGLNNFEEVCINEKKYHKYHKNFGCTIHPHNLYIQALVESGLIGFILFVAFVLSIFLKINKCNIKTTKIILFILILVLFWPLMSTGSFLKNWNMLFICYIIGISLSLTQTNKFIFKKKNENKKDYI